jgi:hypothetical protein
MAGVKSRGLNKALLSSDRHYCRYRAILFQFLGRTSKIFDQYLRTAKVPTLECKTQKGKYRWTNVIENFDMPVSVSIDGGEMQLITPTTTFQEFKEKKLRLMRFFTSSRK